MTPESESRDSMTELPAEVRRSIAEHHELYLRDPAAAHWWDPAVIGVPGGPVACLLLFHTGRRTGRKLNSILQYYAHNGEVAIVASKGGAVDHPAWYSNLLDESQCEVRIGTFSSPARARTVGGAERTHWWSLITREQPVQLEYAARTSREIPVVVLEMDQPPPASLLLQKPAD